MILLKKFLILIQRRLAASEFGLGFKITADLKIPDQILFRNKVGSIKKDSAVRGSEKTFLDIFIDDCYKIRDIRPNTINSILDIGGHVGPVRSCARSNYPKFKSIPMSLIQNLNRLGVDIVSSVKTDCNLDLIFPKLY